MFSIRRIWQTTSVIFMVVAVMQLVFFSAMPGLTDGLALAVAIVWWKQDEILLRMKDDEGIVVPSSAFFSAAERYQLMPQIDRWVVNAALTAAAVSFDKF